MNLERLSQLGFSVAGSGEDAVVSAELMLPLLNPLTKRFIEKVSFRLRDGRLQPLSPAEFKGMPPMSLAGLERYSDFETQLHAAYDEMNLRLQRRSAELQALGVEPQVDPDSLELHAELSTAGLRIRVAADKQGNFRISEAYRGDRRLPLSGDVRFELSEFRDGRALGAYLETLLTDAAGPQRSLTPAPGMVQVSATPITLGELARAFGEESMVPQKTTVEIVADLRVNGARYRFAASRVAGRTFRGLLAGASGKVWADRFELEEFPGVVTLAAHELGVPQESVEVLHLEAK